MYTRAGLFSSCVLIVPAMLLALLAAAVLVSRGQLQTTGTLARASRYTKTVNFLAIVIFIVVCFCCHASAVLLEC